MTSPRLIKGGLVQVDVKSGRTLRTIALQYNPESLSRTMQVQAAGESGGDKSHALRIKGAAAETIKVEAEIDATDRLEHPDQNRTAGEVGIHPELAALELLVQPTSDALQGNDSIARGGALEVLAIETPCCSSCGGRTASCRCASPTSRSRRTRSTPSSIPFVRRCRSG